jgi:phospholipase/carboxylesterase
MLSGKPSSEIPSARRAGSGPRSAPTSPLCAIYWTPASGGKPNHLIVLCHGVGGDGYQLAHLVDSWASQLPHAAFVAPDAPLRHCKHRWRPTFPWAREDDGRAWFDLRKTSLAGQEAGVRAATASLDLFIDSALARLSLPDNAYSLVGFSQGAMTAVFAGLRRHPAPRAILSYAGGLIAPSSLATEIRNKAPVLLVHGEADPIVDCGRSRAAAQTLRGLDLPVTCLYRPGLGHSIDEAGCDAGSRFIQRALKSDMNQTWRVLPPGENGIKEVLDEIGPAMPGSVR